MSPEIDPQIAKDLFAEFESTGSFSTVLGTLPEGNRLAEDLDAAFLRSGRDFGQVFGGDLGTSPEIQVRQTEEERFKELARAFLWGFFRCGALPFDSTEAEAHKLIESLREIRRSNDSLKNRFDDAKHYRNFTSRAMVERSLCELEASTHSAACARDQFQTREAGFWQGFWTNTYNVCIRAAEIEGI